MQEIESFLQNIRAHYLTGYIERIQQYRKEFGEVSAEALAHIDGKETLPPIYRLHRVDLSSNEVSPPDVTEFNPETHITFKATNVNLNDKLKIRLEPFLWNEAEIECSSLDPKNEYLAQWGIRWINPKGKNPTDENGLGGYAHSISYPERKVNKFAFYVDFGSAPVRSFQELMGVLMLLGVEKVRVRTPNLKTLHSILPASSSLS